MANRNWHPMVVAAVSASTESVTMDHFRLTPAETRESVDLAIVAD